MWARINRKFFLRLRLPRQFRDLLHDANLQHGTYGFTSLPKEGVLMAALKALRAVRTTSLLVHQCQRALNDISTRHALGFFGSQDMLEYGAMKSLMGSLWASLLSVSSDPSRPWGSLGENYKRGSVAG